MKRLISLCLIAVCMIAVFAGCGDSDKLQAGSSSTVTSGDDITLSEQFDVNKFDSRFDKSITVLGSDDVLSMIYYGKDYAKTLAENMYQLYGQDKLQAMPDYDDYMNKANKSVFEMSDYDNNQVLVRFSDDDSYESDSRKGTNADAEALKSAVPADKMKVSLKDAVHKVLDGLQNKDNIWYISADLTVDNKWYVKVGCPGENLSRSDSMIYWIANKSVDIETGDVKTVTDTDLQSSNQSSDDSTTGTE